MGPQATRPAHQKTQVLFLLKEIHARPHRAGKFHEIRDENEAGLEFELFLFCWLVSETELPLRIVDGPHLTLRRPAAPFVNAERIVGDMGNWRLGKLNQELDSSDLLVIRAAQESISELNTVEPLEGGLPRKGWLHFRVCNMTPAQFKASTLELSISDSLSNLHLSTTSGPRYLPGRMWPFTPSAKPASPDTYSGSGPSLATGS